MGMEGLELEDGEGRMGRGGKLGEGCGRGRGEGLSVANGCGKIKVIAYCLVHVSTQESKLYYDADQGTYYYFDPETRQYSVHSRVKLPAKTESDQEKVESKSKDDVINLCSSEEEFIGALNIAAAL